MNMVLLEENAPNSWPEIVGRLGLTDQLLILKKPLDDMVLRQIACAMTRKWSVAERERARCATLDRLVEQHIAAINGKCEMTVLALAKLGESRDPFVGNHVERLRDFAQVLARHLAAKSIYRDEITEDFLEDLYGASPMHDIGKIVIPESVLLKPGRLTASELEIMKTHCAIGSEALDKEVQACHWDGFLAMAAEIVHYHHERFDGEGYPSGLAGQDIPLSARIVALADVYDALTSARVYKQAIGCEAAAAEIEEESGGHFDPVIVEAFLAGQDDFMEIQKSGAAEEIQAAVI